MKKHRIEIIVPYLQQNIIPFINHVVTTATTNGVQVCLENTKLIKACDDCDTAHGLFADVPHPVLKVACDNPFNVWFPTLVHESCHMDQWIEQIPMWNESYVMGIDANDILDLWTNHKIELTPDQRNVVIKSIRDIEVDCERRAIDKVNKFDLPINVEEYIKKANAYAYYYTVLGETRAWPCEHEAYEIEEIWTKMPESYQDSYDVLPDNIREAFRVVLPQL